MLKLFTEYQNRRRDTVLWEQWKENTQLFAFYFWFSGKDFLKISCFCRWHKDNLTYQGEAVSMAHTVWIPERCLILTQILHPLLISKLRLYSLNNVCILHLTRVELKIKQSSWPYLVLNLNPLTENRPDLPKALLPTPLLVLLVCFSLSKQSSPFQPLRGSELKWNQWLGFSFK